MLVLIAFGSATDSRVRVTLTLTLEFVGFR